MPELVALSRISREVEGSRRKAEFIERGDSAKFTDDEAERLLRLGVAAKPGSDEAKAARAE